MARPLTYNPASLLNINKNPIKLKINAMSYGKLIEALVDEPCTYEDLEEATGLNIWTIRNAVRVLMGEVGGVKKLVHICGWERDCRGQSTIRVYRFAPGLKDKPQPIKKPAQRAAAYRERKKIKQLAAALTTPLEGASA